MTITKPPQTDCRKLSRRVSSYTLSGSETEDDKLKESLEENELLPTREKLTRQVSNDLLVTVASTKDVLFGRKSPVRCVTEFDKASGSLLDITSKCQATLALQQNMEDASFPVNPLSHERMLMQHSYSLRLEAELHPLRLILSRLMSHITLNKKGIFNIPVDPVALNLPDYFSIITRPMDLGTVRVKLHSLEYHSARDVVDDIRLVFQNAMRFNPPHHVVHISAKGLLSFFEDQLEAFVPELISSEQSSTSVESSEEVHGCLPSRHNITEAVHKQGTLNATSSDANCTFLVAGSRKRKKRGARTNSNHDCRWCEGRTCALCSQGCLHVEPALLICSGSSCVGSKIRKGAVYYVAPDGSRQYCQKCFVGLPAVLPTLSSHDENCRYKKDLLKRKNDEEIVERWLTCISCDSAVHKICAMHNEYACDQVDYRCNECVGKHDSLSVDPMSSTKFNFEDSYTFLTGSPSPVKMSELLGEGTVFGDQFVTADGLPSTSICSFIELKVRELLESNGFYAAAKTITVRTISDCEKTFHVPDVVRKHFQIQEPQGEDVAPPACVPYQSKAIALFQKIDGMDVCIFCMYVQEYEESYSQPKRVYIAYLDSVEHFRPRPCRTQVYQEVLVSYLATARKRGFESAHIWACPPSRGNSFVFWNHPTSQRTPTKERLISWYHGALSRAMECGVVTDVRSLYESSFQDFIEKIDEKCQRPDAAQRRSGKVQCPPLFEGDFWVEEAVRLHAQYFSRYLRATLDSDFAPSEGTHEAEICPAVQVAQLLRNIITSHPSAQPFKRPVNAAAMNLKDYHKIIEKPMDLGTVYSRCVLGEYEELRDLVSDVNLVFSNAKLYNPKGHYVHNLAEELEAHFFSELGKLAKNWSVALQREDYDDWTKFMTASLSLDATLLSTFEADLMDSEKAEGFECRDNDATPDQVQNGQGEKMLDSVHVAKEGCTIVGDAAFIHRRMIGDDTWLLDKRNPTPKDLKVSSQKIHPGRKRKSASESEESCPKRRRQTWLGEEIGAAVRLMRESFFCCSLVAPCTPNDNIETFNSYSRNYTQSTPCYRTTSRVADARHSLLEFLQFRNLEFDTLRRAKYSTSTLLHHLHFGDASGVVPKCSECNMDIEDVRWHKTCRVVERRQASRPPPKCVRLTSPTGTEGSEPEELCSVCLSARTNQDAYVPFQVSFKL